MVHCIRDSSKFKPREINKQRQDVNQYENIKTEKQYKQPI